MSGRTTYTVRVDEDKAGGRIDKLLAAAVEGLSRSRIQALIAEGHVRRDDAVVVDGAAKARTGDVFQVDVPPARPAAPRPVDLPLNVVFEDRHLIVIDKPAGLVVHPAAGHHDDTLVNALLHHCRGELSGIGGVSRPGIVHRLDKDTSGLLVAAKDDATHQGLAAQFARHSIERAYWALVWGRPRDRRGSIEGNIGRSPRNRKKMAVLKRGGKAARTHYRVLRAAADLVSMIECRLETGRTHQIRVHLASRGHPVVGDPLYGGGMRRNADSQGPEIGEFLATRTSQVLHACQLGFHHPINNEKLLFSSTNTCEINDILEFLDVI